MAVAPADDRLARGLGAVATATAFLLPVACSPSVEATFWTPKAAVVLLAGLVGLSQLPRLVRDVDDRRPGVVAVAFLLVAGTATVVSPRPVEALLGRYNWGTGLVFIACVVGCWALAVVADTRRVLNAALAGLALSCGVAVLQALIELPFDALDTSGRSVGLAGNAVHLGALAAGGAAACAWFRPAWTSLAGVAGFSAVVHLSGTRVALGSLVVLIVACCFRFGVRRAAVVTAAVLCGLAIGMVVGAASSDPVSGATGRTLGGDAAAGGTVRVRLHVWSGAVDDVFERPLLGHGPGRFQAATSHDRRLEEANIEGPGLLYADGHNPFVEYATTTGVLGVAALAAWLALATRRAAGPALAAAALIGVSWLVQPQSVATTPLLALLLGTATTLSVTTRSKRWAAPAAAFAVAGVALGATLVVGDWALHRANDSLVIDDAELAERLLPAWPQPASAMAQAHAFASVGSVGADAARHRDAALRWRREAARRQSGDPAPRLLLAATKASFGDRAAAARAYHRALEADPWSLAAMVGLAETEDRSWWDRAIAVWGDRARDAKQPGP